jgi:hypothetical protein
MFTETVTVPVSDSLVEEPLVGFRLSQAALSLTDQRRSSPPEFHTLRVRLGGLGPPWVVVKLRLVGL